MAFGIPNSDSGSGSGEFLGRIQYDARVGFWMTVKRVQDSDGSWSDQKSEPFKGVSFLMDFGTLEVGYIKLSSPPSFLVVPYGGTIPQQPEEMQTDAQGKQRKAFQPGFRIKIMSPKTFGDGDAYYFSNSSKTVLGPMDELHTVFNRAPEAASGLIPAVQCLRSQAITIKTPKGTNTFYAPVFEIVSWHDRPEVFGARTVPAPVSPLATAAPAAPAKPNGAMHVPPPAPAAAPPSSMPF